jgi:pimeloyl-ACP methyl ester carboxylesterase
MADDRNDTDPCHGGVRASPDPMYTGSPDDVAATARDAAGSGRRGAPTRLGGFDMRRLGTTLAASAACLAIVAGCTGAATSGSSARPGQDAATSVSPVIAAPSANHDLLADLDIGGGRTMHLLCVGPIDSGEPTVIFESGLTGDAGQWSDVLHELDGSVRACAYDRAGDGQSPPADAPAGRTTADQLADLRALLDVADVEPPYLLVGYSVGGWNALLHAERYPADVVGAVLVDVRPPAASERWAAAMPPETPDESEAIHLTRTDPETFEKDPTGNPEGLLLAESAGIVASSKLGDRPLVVLAGADTAGITEGFDGPLASTVLDIWWELQEELAARSSNGRLEKVDGAGHDLPIERADAVAVAIKSVLGG